jgi:hypothetical protein
MTSSGTIAPLLSPQLRLPFVHDPSSLRDRLGCLTGKTVVLTITDNSASMLSARSRSGEVHVRLHRMFLHAGEDVLEAVAGFLKGKKDCGPAIRDYVKKNNSGVKLRTTTCVTLRPRGAVYCLTEVFDRVNRTFFQERVSAGITWGKNRRNRRARRITLGSYCRAANIIRINPLLDRKSVPRYFLEFIVYHEMLHADLGFTALNGRRKLHTKEFRVRERQFPEYEKAVAWEKQNL